MKERKLRAVRFYILCVLDDLILVPVRAYLYVVLLYQTIKQILILAIIDIENTFQQDSFMYDGDACLIIKARKLPSAMC